MVLPGINHANIEKLAIVFVHLGDNPSPNLLSSAKYARSTNPNARIILIADYTDNWTNFPGEVVKAEPSSKNEVKHLVKGARYLKKIAGGYWVNTYERLFVLRQLSQILENDVWIVHLESDVVIQETRILENAIAELKIRHIGVPRMNAELGIASILISRNFIELSRGLDELSKLAKDFPEVCTNDMRLLGLALNKELITELPSRVPVIQPAPRKREYFLFEGAAFGQYLFGQDPIHTAGKRLSGFQNPDYPIQLSTLKWGVEENNVFAEDSNIRFWFVNLHIHSKEKISPPMIDPNRWEQVIKEANGETIRISAPLVPELIHSRGYSFIVKAEIFLRNKIKAKKT